MYHFCCKTFSFANESKNTLDESDNWQIALKSNRANKASVLKILFVAIDSDKIFKESDNWNQVYKIRDEKVNIFRKMSVR